MAFTDWTHVGSAAIGDTPTVGLDATVTHIEANKSYLVQTDLANNPTDSRNIAGRDIGVEFAKSGNDMKIQTMFRRNPSLCSPFVWLCMSTSISVANTCYMAAWTTAPAFQIWKGTPVQLSEGTATLLATMSGAPVFVNSSIYALGLQCHYDTASATMFLAASLDSNAIVSPDTYAFATLEEVISYSDTSSPLNGRPRAGIGTALIAAGGPGVNVKMMDMDVTQILST